jgi:hypothetical protein
MILDISSAAITAKKSIPLAMYQGRLMESVESYIIGVIVALSASKI